jgi:RNase P/RNase MRP subunit POP5
VETAKDEMVRFKNRYLLVELIPFKVNDDSAIQKPSKKARIGDLARDDPRQQTPASEQAAQDKAMASLHSSSVASLIRQSLESNFGVHAAATSAQSLSVKYCNAKTGMVLVRAARDQLPQVWSSIAFLTGIPGSSEAHFRYTWRVVHVAGTMRSAQKFAIALATRKIKATLQLAHTEEERKRILLMLRDAEQAIKALES